MKQKQILIILLMASVFACKKDTSIKPASIVGTWRWISTFAGLPPGYNDPFTPTLAGYTQTLVFKDNSEWYLLKDNIKVDSGTYSTGYGEHAPYQGSYIYKYDSVRYYRLGDNRNISDAYVVREDTLTLSSSLRANKTAPYIAENGSMKWKKM